MNHNLVDLLLATADQLDHQATAKIEMLYHGTSSKFLRSILKNGLVPPTDPEDKVWTEDPAAKMFMPSRGSYDGIYLAKNLMTALSAAWNAKQKFGGNRLLVITQGQMQQAIPDEDSYVGFINSLLYRSAEMAPEHEYSMAVLYAQLLASQGSIPADWSEYPEGLDKSKDEIKRYKKAFYDGFQKTLQSKHPEMEPLLNKLFEQAILRAASYLDKRTYWNACERVAYLSRDHFEDLPSLPSKSSAEKDFQLALDAVMRASKKLSPRGSDFNVTLRLTQPIGFSGSNKIVSVLEIVPAPEDSGRHEDLLVHWGEPPEQFIRDWEQAIGKNSKLMKK